jgi:hypothetical protein
MSYELGLKAARATLRAYALARKVEASIIVNQQNGEHLDFQTGTQDEVTPDWSKIPPGARVTVLHTHHLNIGFGPEDWDALANQPLALEIQAVCPDEIHVLRKPADWAYQPFCVSGVSVFGSLFKRILAQVRKEKPFANERYVALDAAQIAQIAETNQRMVRSHVGQGFLLTKE